MDTIVQPPSAHVSARAILPVLDKEGPETDRRRELTPGAVNATVGRDLLRLPFPKPAARITDNLVQHA